MVVPRLTPVPYWWPLLWQHAVDYVCLGGVGQKDVVCYPSKKGFAPDTVGLPWDLLAVRLTF
jgi:hypothetical protein